MLSMNTRGERGSANDIFTCLSGQRKKEARKNTHTERLGKHFIYSIAILSFDAHSFACE